VLLNTLAWGDGCPPAVRCDGTQAGPGSVQGYREGRR
jgi:hypothetical protein